jgi:hypothetical protein
MLKPKFTLVLPHESCAHIKHVLVFGKDTIVAGVSMAPR